MLNVTRWLNLISGTIALKIRNLIYTTWYGTFFTIFLFATAKQGEPSPFVEKSFFS